ncbi:MAG: transcription-repair coupling factor, partial [Legionella sp.]|nr:transcription-repair coupling factor [Legionella sp.]
MKIKTLLYQPTKPKEIWGQLYGSSLALALAEYCQETKGIKLIIAQDNLSASQLQNELQFFLNPERATQELLFFPDWETLPYDQFSPHQDIISERLYTLSRLQQVTDAIIITSASTLMHRLCPPEFLNQYALMLKEGQKIDIGNFRNQLQQSGYHCVNKVLEHGEFAVRGSIIDVYPMGSNRPFRIELFDDEIDSLRQFDTETQRTI